MILQACRFKPDFTEACRIKLGLNQLALNSGVDSYCELNAMRRPLLFLLFVGYIAAAVYSIGRTNGGAKLPPATFKASFQPSRPTLARLTLTTTKLETLALFYNEVFQADLQPTELEHRQSAVVCQQGRLSNVRLFLCTSDHQKEPRFKPQSLRFTVDNLAAAITAVEMAGGTRKQPTVEKSANQRQGTKQTQKDERANTKAVTVFDPDGNEIELTQAP